MRSKTAISLLLVALLSISQNSSWAHGELIKSNPKAGSTISKMPKSVWVEFDGNLISIADKQINFLTVKNSKGKVFSEGKAFISGGRISVNIKDRSATGAIKVSWRVVSEDGHPVTSSLTFTVKK